MSTILLPAVRSERANLFPYTTAGTVTNTSSSHSFGASASVAASQIWLSDVGLAVGDFVSGRGEIRTNEPGTTARMEIRAYDASGTLRDAKWTSVAAAEYPAWTGLAIDAFQIPAGTAYLQLRVVRATDSGTASIRNGILNRGRTAQPYDIPKRGADAPWTDVLFEFDRNEVALPFATGIEQITSYARRLWMMRLALPVMSGDELREWSHAIHRLTSLGNVFRFAVPEYDGPSTGYRGANPLVNGAGQTGTSLVCDGVDASTDILGPGDYLSFEVTSPKGNVNVQLARVASLATSDASGNVTFTLETPIRLSPADNAVVQIQAPVAQFRLVQSRGGSSLDRNRVSPFVLDAVEKIFP